MSPAIFSEFEEISSEKVSSYLTRVAWPVIWRELVLYQAFIRPNDVKWRFAGQRAANSSQLREADVVRAHALCRVVRRSDDVSQTEERLVHAELSMANRLNPPGVDTGGKARVPD